MKPAALLFLALVTASPATGDCGLVRIALYPNYQAPETAWRITIHGDGSIQFEESSTPVETATVDRFGEVVWTWQEPEHERTLSPRKMTRLVAGLRELDLGALEPEYTAGFSYDVPGETGDVIVDGVLKYTVQVRATRVVTHGATYELCANLDGVVAHSFVYAPRSALEDEDPPHPDRDAIRTVVAAWHQVLRATGPVHGMKAKMYRRYLE